MATESADGPEVSVTLPPPLDEWLDERADALGVERTELLVQLVSAYRATSDLDHDPVEALLEDRTGEGLDELVEARVDERIEGRLEDELADRIDGRIDEPDAGGSDPAALGAQLEALEATHEEDVEDVRTRVLQLRDAVSDRAEEDHDHDEFRDLGGRLDALASTLEDVGADLGDLTDRVHRRDGRLGDLESKLDRLAGVVLAMREGSDRIGPVDEVLEHIRASANRNGVEVAECADCGRAVRIALLTRPACPHCETAFRDLEEPPSGLGRWLAPRKSKLVGTEPPALESADE